MTDRGSKQVLIQKMNAMFSCAHRACMVVYSIAACNTCQPMTSAERMRKPQLQSRDPYISTDLWLETQFSKRAVTCSKRRTWVRHFQSGSTGRERPRWVEDRGRKIAAADLQKKEREVSKYLQLYLVVTCMVIGVTGSNRPVTKGGN